MDHKVCTTRQHGGDSASSMHTERNYIGLGIEPSDDNEDESESEPMSSDDDSNAESFVSLDSFRS